MRLSLSFVSHLFCVTVISFQLQSVKQNQAEQDNIHYDVIYFGTRSRKFKKTNMATLFAEPVTCKIYLTDPTQNNRTTMHILVSVNNTLFISIQ